MKLRAQVSRNFESRPVPSSPSVAFLLTGVASWQLRKSLTSARGWLVNYCVGSVALIGLAGLAGHLLRLEALYQIA